MSKPLFSRTINLHAGDTDYLRTQLRQYFISTYDRYESLFETLVNDDAYYIKSNSLRHPLIFYFGHTATFFINKLLLAQLISERINPRFESIFAVGVDEMSWDDLDSTPYAWPSVSEVRQYRNQVRQCVMAVIDMAPLKSIDWHSTEWVILMGIEHERIHLETSSVLIRQHCRSRVQSHPDWLPCRITSSAPKNELVAIPAGQVLLNKTHADPFYGWDNEYGLHQADVAEFNVSRYLVSNREFLEFVQANGYHLSEIWSEEGREWLEYAQAQHPCFWIKTTSGWRLRLMTEEVDMPWDWPVEVNYHEAKAFCEWKKQCTGKSIRLPTEDEWYRLYDYVELQAITDTPANANIHLDHYASACPVNQFPHGSLYDVTGNVWQWTETAIYPLEGFEVHPIYDDFTTPTYDGRHNLIKGGSWASCGNETLRSARYAFRRHFYQHAGFRYVDGDAIKAVPDSHYETDKLLSEYAEFHYGDEFFGVTNFSKSLVEIAAEVMNNRPCKKALDIGCASGRASFELARHFDQVTGIDFSARFIGQGVQLRETGNLRYTLVDEGDLVSYKSRSLIDLDLSDIKQKVEFFQGDACNLKPQFSGYDFILAANLIDRLYNPKKFLSAIHDRLNIGGVMLLASPYTWLAEHTPREEWVGGFKKDGENLSTLDGLTNILRDHFVLLQEPQEVPFVIRETKRKFQHTLSEVTIWLRVK